VDDASTRAAEIVAGLTELSSEIRRVVLAEGNGDVLAGSGGGDGESLARVGVELLALAVEGARAGADVGHVVVAAPNSAVIACRAAGRIAVATTTPEAAEALVLYDLRAALRRFDELQRPPKRRRVKAKDGADA
jgi:hypothetical protein